MAFLAAAAPYIAGLSAAAGVYSAAKQVQIGKIQQAELKAQAKTEAVAAGQQQIERRRALIRALSSQNAAAGAAGVEFGGSLEAIARRDIKDAQNDLLVLGMNSQNRQRALRSQASNSTRIANANAATSLLDTINSTYKAAG